MITMTCLIRLMPVEPPDGWVGGGAALLGAALPVVPVLGCGEPVHAATNATDAATASHARRAIRSPPGTEPVADLISVSEPPD
jgi:hypothetical protein